MNQQFEEKFESRRRKLKEKLGLNEDDVNTDDCESEGDAEIEIDNKEFFSVEAVWDTRKVNGQKQYEVKWKGFPETSWEPLDSFITKSSRLAIVQFYERMWKKKQDAKLDPQSRADSNKKFSSSLGGKRPSSSSAAEPRRKDRVFVKSEILPTMDPQSRANSNKKFSCSLGGKRPSSSNAAAPQRRDRVFVKPEFLPTMNSQSRADSNKKFSSSLGGKRPSSSIAAEPRKKDQKEEKGWVKKMKIYQEKERQTKERIQYEEELAKNRMEESKLMEYLERMKKLKADLTPSDDEIDNNDLVS